MEHPIDIEPAGAAQHREAARDSLFLVATIRRLVDNSERVVRVRNLSQGGMMADCTDLLQRGEPVAVALRGVGEVRGRIVWLSTDKVGISFDTAIDPKAARKTRNAVGSTVPTHIRPIDTKRPPIR